MTAVIHSDSAMSAPETASTSSRPTDPASFPISERLRP